MSVRGDFAELDRLRRDMDSAALKSRLLKAAAAEARTLVALEFRQSVDPAGDPWAPLASRKGQILRKTGRGANSFTARPTDRGFIVGTNVEYMGVHQTGGTTRKPKGKRKSRAKVGKIPKREIVPTGGLTPRWKAAIDKATDVAVKNYFRKK
jgi:phage gpG-like protein